MADFKSWIYFKSISALNWILSISKTNGEGLDPIGEALLIFHLQGFQELMGGAKPSNISIVNP